MVLFDVELGDLDQSRCKGQFTLNENENGFAWRISFVQIFQAKSLSLGINERSSLMCLHTHSTTCKLTPMFHRMGMRRVGGTPISSKGLGIVPVPFIQGYQFHLERFSSVYSNSEFRRLKAPLRSCHLTTERQEQ